MILIRKIGTVLLKTRLRPSPLLSPRATVASDGDGSWAKYGTRGGADELPPVSGVVDPYVRLVFSCKPIIHRV